MTPTSLAASHTGKIIKSGIREFGKMQNGILHFACKLSQSSEIVLQS